MTPNATPLTPTTAHTAQASAPASASPFAPGPLWGGLALAALAAFAFVVSKKRGRPARRLELLESMGLGPRRSLCLVRVDGRALVLGVSEAGVQLLTQHEASAFAPEEAASAALTAPSDVSVAQEALAFERLLVESTAEQELKARLSAARQGGVVQP
jgi:flagellar biogenesis protein FliO